MAEPKPVDGGDGKIPGVTEQSLGVDCSTDEEGSPTNVLLHRGFEPLIEALWEDEGYVQRHESASEAGYWGPERRFLMEACGV
jgi:hypothetical protein